MFLNAPSPSQMFLIPPLIVSDVLDQPEMWQCTDCWKLYIYGHYCEEFWQSEWLCRRREWTRMSFKHGLSNYVGCVCGRLGYYFWFLHIAAEPWRGLFCHLNEQIDVNSCLLMPRKPSCWMGAGTSQRFCVYRHCGSRDGFDGDALDECGWWSVCLLFRFRAGFLHVSHRCWVYAERVMDLFC